MRRHYPRRVREIPAIYCLGGETCAAPIGGVDGSGHRDDEQRLTAALARLRAHCPDFKNFEFRAAVMDVAEAGDGGREDCALVHALRVAPPIQLRHTARLGGIACSSRRFPLVEVQRVRSALDATVSIRAERGICLKPGLIFAAHPVDADILCTEERELLQRTNWSTGFVDVATQNALRGEQQSVNARHGGESDLRSSHHRIAAGAPECLFAEQLLVLRSADGEVVRTPLDLEAAICFLPQRRPVVTHGGVGGYARREDRLAYKRQVEAVLKVCCLLDLDALCIGCAEGVAGGSLFGHPLGEAAEVWREVLHDPRLSPSGAPMAAQFKRIVFATAAGVPFSAKTTADTLTEVFADSLAPDAD